MKPMIARSITVTAHLQAPVQGQHSYDVELIDPCGRPEHEKE
jgi:hypothetical protein